MYINMAIRLKLCLKDENDEGLTDTEIKKKWIHLCLLDMTLMQ